METPRLAKFSVNLKHLCRLSSLQPTRATTVESKLCTVCKKHYPELWWLSLGLEESHPAKVHTENSKLSKHRLHKPVARSIVQDHPPKSEARSMPSTRSSDWLWFGLDMSAFKSFKMPPSYLSIDTKTLRSFPWFAFGCLLYWSWPIWSLCPDSGTPSQYRLFHSAASATCKWWQVPESFNLAAYSCSEYHLPLANPARSAPFPSPHLLVDHSRIAEAGPEWSAVKIPILILLENSSEEPLIVHNSLTGG